MTNTFKYRLTTTLNYSHISDVFSQLIDTAEKSKAFITKKNLADQDIVSLNISMPFQYKWYSVFANVNTYYSKYRADFGEGRTINLDVFAVNVYAQQSFKLGKRQQRNSAAFIHLPLSGRVPSKANKCGALMPVFSKRSSKERALLRQPLRIFSRLCVGAAPAILPAST